MHILTYQENVSLFLLAFQTCCVDRLSPSSISLLSDEVRRFGVAQPISVLTRRDLESVYADAAILTSWR
jgi:hypothetical protein